MLNNLAVRQVTPGDHDWVETLINERWGAPYVVAHGELIVPADLAGLIAEANGEQVGLLTYRVRDVDCEVVTLDAIRRAEGTGTALIEAASTIARQEGCRRIWLITTNDNLDALRFYQRRGFRLVRVHPGAVERSRSLKPIPLIGEYGIPIRDELELELALDT